MATGKSKVGIPSTGTLHAGNFTARYLDAKNMNEKDVDAVDACSRAIDARDLNAAQASSLTT